MNFVSMVTSAVVSFHFYVDNGLQTKKKEWKASYYKTNGFMALHLCHKRRRFENARCIILPIYHIGLASEHRCPMRNTNNIERKRKLQNGSILSSK